MIAIRLRTMIAGANVWAAPGKSGIANRIIPYAPSFRRIAARITEPAVGAWTWASGSQVWNGNIGTLIAKARKKARNAKSWRFGSKLALWRSSKSKAPAQLPVLDWKANAVARIATSIRSDP